MFLTREEFLAAPSRATEDVPLPMFGGKKVRVVGMTAREKTDWERSFRTTKGNPIEARQREVRERLVVACCRTEDGKPLFTDSDIKSLGERRADAVELLVSAAQRVCGMTDTDVETLAKNDGATTDGASPAA